jgi:hypothetical protein
MSYQVNIELRVSSFPGPMTIQEAERVSQQLRDQIEKLAEMFLADKFVNVPVLRVRGPSITYLAD